MLWYGTLGYGGQRCTMRSVEPQCAALLCDGMLRDGVRGFAMLSAGAMGGEMLWFGAQCFANALLRDAVSGSARGGYEIMGAVVCCAQQGVGRLWLAVRRGGLLRGAKQVR